MSVSLIQPSRGPSWLRFGLVGALNTAVGLLVIYACKWFFSIPDFAANAVGYGVSIGQSFLLNGRWTFSFEGPVGRALGRFFIVVAMAYCANFIALAALVSVVHFNGYLAQAIAVVPYVCISYFGMKHYAFASSARPA